MARKRNVKLIKKPKPARQRMKVVAIERDKEIKKVLRQHQELRYLAVEGWSSRSRPKGFPQFLQKQSGGIRFGVRVDSKPAESAKISVYRLLNDGTKMRKVVLNHPYSNKTIPGRFGQFGFGGGIRRTKSGRPVLLKKPAPGIKARRFDETANFALEPTMTDAIKKGYKKGFSKL